MSAPITVHALQCHNHMGLMGGVVTVATVSVKGVWMAGPFLVTRAICPKEHRHMPWMSPTNTIQWGPMVQRHLRVKIGPSGGDDDQNSHCSICTSPELQRTPLRIGRGVQSCP